MDVYVEVLGELNWWMVKFFLEDLGNYDDVCWEGIW